MAKEGGDEEGKDASRRLEVRRQSKVEGENKIRENLSEATIIKPSIVHSVDDNFSTKLMTLLRILPLFPLYYNGETKYSPIHASEVAELISFVISERICSKDIEAIGPEVLSFKRMIQILLKSINKKRLLLPNPLLTIDQLRLLKYDNIKSDKGITNFDIGCPSKIIFEKSVSSYSYNWRDGGKYSITKTDKL